MSAPLVSISAVRGLGSLFSDGRHVSRQMTLDAQVVAISGRVMVLTKDAAEPASGTMIVLTVADARRFRDVLNVSIATAESYGVRK